MCQVVLQWETAYATAFQIQVSADASTWSTIYSTTTGTGGTQTFNVSGSGRYIRMYGTARATGYGYSLWEFTVNTTGGTTSPSPTASPSPSPTGGTGPTEYCGYQDLALGQPTTASSTFSATGNLASAATDGNPGSRWESAYSDPQWLEVDLGSQIQICGASLLWEAAYASAFQIQVSNDNATWSTVYSTTTGGGGSQSLTFSATDRYIRVYATVRATQWGDSILEFRVYGLTTVAPISGGNGNGGNGVCPWVNSTAPVAQRVQQVLNTMNQSEEFTLLSGDGGSSYIGQVAAIPNLCIKAMNMQDGPNGVGDGTGGVTAYADGENAAATWDPALIQQEGAAMGAEFAGKGVNVSLGPTTNLVRDPRWGRTYETYGEDPYLAGQITAAEVMGLQSQGVQAMVKHVAAYDQEQYPNGNNNETVSEQALQELYLAPFQSAIYQSAPASFMCSYAVVNSAASCQNADMQIKGLNNEANFGGYITSDWGADYNNVASVVGGMEIGMPFPGSIATDMANAIANGTLSQYAVNAAVARILTQMFAFGMFDNPATGSLSNTRDLGGAPADRAAAQRGGLGPAEEQRDPAAEPERYRVDRRDRHRRRRRRGTRRRRQRHGDQLQHDLADHRDPERGRVRCPRHLHRRQRQRHHQHPAGGRRGQGSDRRDHLRQPPGGRGERPDHAEPVQHGRVDDPAGGGGEPEHHRGGQQRSAGHHAVAELGRRRLRGVVPGPGGRNRHRRADLRRREPLRQAAGHLPEQS